MTPRDRATVTLPTAIDVVAVIPARGGSKGVPGKNLAVVGGRSLVARAIESCRASGAVDLIVVSTDDEGIAAEAERFDAVVVERPPDLAGDEASSESAVLHSIDTLRARSLTPAIVAFVQCTSPFISPTALASAVDRVRSGQADSVFAACETFEFLWRRSSDGTAHGVNHDPSFRPRRQERVSDWRETGAFYVMAADGFVAAEHRFFGRVEIEPVDPSDSVEVDTPGDLHVARAIAASRTHGLGRLADVGTLVTDFDGVHTDDTALVDETGREAVRVNRRDGHGVKLLRAAGVQVLILSTEANSVVARRAEKLGVECLHGLDDKAAALSAWMISRGIEPASVAYLGNDVNDVGCLELVGHPMAVADAHELVRGMAAHVTTAAGGQGAVREVAEAILDARGARAD